MDAVTWLVYPYKYLVDEPAIASPGMDVEFFVENMGLIPSLPKNRDRGNSGKYNHVEQHFNLLN